MLLIFLIAHIQTDMFWFLLLSFSYNLLNYARQLCLFAATYVPAAGQALQHILCQYAYY